MINKLSDSSKKIAEEIDNEVKISNDEKRIIQIKHEKLSAEFKHVKTEYEETKKESMKLSVALKSSRKETKEISKHFEN